MCTHFGYLYTMPELNRRGRRKPWIAKRKGRPKVDPAGNMQGSFTGYGADRDKRYKTAQWRATREAVLYRDPTCVWCLPCGKLTASTEVDHVIPAQRLDDDTHFYDQTNLVGSCRSCNARRASYEAKGVYFETVEEWQDFLKQKTLNKRK